MSHILPPDPPISPSNRVWADVPDSFWGPVLDRLKDEMDLPPGLWHRMPKGKNVVLALGDHAILKFIPPFWAEDAGLEIAALEAVPAGGPVATPRLLLHGIIDGWTVLLMERLPGSILSEQWPSLNMEDRAEPTLQIGVIAAWLHGLTTPVASPLSINWTRNIRDQEQSSFEALAEDGAPSVLRATWSRFLAQVGPLPTPGSTPVLLHGDLSTGNLIVQETEGTMRITGLVDFGDASLGEWIHDWISPGIHNFGGDPGVVLAFCEGYGLPSSKRTPELQAHLLARCVLHYGWSYLRKKFPLENTASWAEVANIMWPLA